MGKCRTPRKRGFNSKAEALHHLHTHDWSDVLFAPHTTYKCPCGAWHLTSNINFREKSKR